MSGGRRHPAKESCEEEQQRLEELASCIRAALPTYSCEIVVRGPTGGGAYLKVRNCLSNTFSFSSSLFAVLRPSVEEERPGLSLSVFTYNEEEVEVEWVACDREAVCALLAEKLAVGNYTFCCGIGEENLVKMDLKFFEIKDTLFEKFGRRAVFRSRTCCRVFDRGECGGSGRQAESQSLCPPCRAWVQAIMDRMLLEGPGQGSSQPASCADPALVLEEPSRAAGLVCLDGEVEQELQRMQGVEQEEEQGPVCSQPKRPGRRKHPCPHPGCDYSARSATVLRCPFSTCPPDQVPRYHLPRHTGESAYCCSTCGARFRHRKELTVCEKRHLGMYDHACTDCSKRFISKKKLNLHLRVHTGEKPFSCPLCPHRCSRRDNLNCHTKKNHGLGWREAEARAGERGVQASVIKLGSNS